MTRVKSKGFIAATILVPVGFLLIIGVGIGISVWESDITFEIGIVDQTNQIILPLREINDERYIDYTGFTEDSLRSLVQAEELTGYIFLDEDHISSDKPLQLIYTGSGGIQLLSSVRSDLREAIREERLQRADVSEDIQNIFESGISLESRRLTEEGQEEEDDTAFFT
ncbi:MAG: ABC transporter permease, partial [Bacteroidetes bacterium]|nr:ABC transporter permease [Bacteroidota bacterium]